ncbi:MAG: M3 family oligoendopeptidase [Gemmatimonadales bacterium]|nr:M3 family oligoendopeptidase [Gemmatimonadales bacterium]
MPQLPPTPAEFTAATWADVEPHYRALAERPLSADTVADWLAEWSRTESFLSEAASLAMIAYTQDTGDPAKEAANLRWASEILPRMEEQSVALQRRLVALGVDVPGLETTLRRFRTSIAIFREANVPVVSALEGLSAEYQKATGGMLAEWEGERIPLPRLNPFLKATDRAVRERAWRATTQPYVDARDTLAMLFDTMLARRQEVARNAGFADFEQYVFQAKFRFDYTPADCRRFHAGVERAVIPAVRRLNEERRRALGVATLRPWDTQVDIHGGEPEPPFRDGADLIARSRGVFHDLDAQLGTWFDTMADEGRLDLDSRKGKAPGGYCDTLAFSGRPFIFMNAAGVFDDVNTLLHEAGHAFHAFAAHPIPYLWQRHPGSEAAELASMSMELLAAPHLKGDGRFFDEEGWVRVRLEHLEDVLGSLAHIASVDCFQSWLYTDGAGADPDARDRQWLAVRERFEQGIDWSGLERERTARWYRQLHIFLYPFYYIEYGIAQLGALQVWRHSLRDPAEAVRRYRSALALGATAPLPAIYEAAGARLGFDEALIEELVGLVEQEMDRLRAQLPVRA